MFSLLWLWLHTLKVFTEIHRGLWHRCPVIDGTMSRLLKSVNLCSMTAQYYLTEERETSLFIQTDFHDMCSPLFSCVSSLDSTEQGPNPQKWIQPHKASWAFCDCLSSCLCLHIVSIHVNHIRYLFRIPLKEGGHYCHILNWLAINLAVLQHL